MHQCYNYQLEFKKNKVINNLKYIGKLDINNNIEIISDKELNCRNHITLNVHNNSIGFYKNKSYDIIDIDECIISNAEINKTIKDIKNFIYKHPNNSIEKISIKAYNNTLINIIGKSFNLTNQFIKYVKCDSLYFNNKHIYGNKNVMENLDKYKYKISALSFFQKNTNMAVKLYNYVKEFINKDDTVLDLYCGTGSIGIFIADKCKEVVGIEVNEDAIKDAKENAILNNTKNTSFICGKVENNINKFNGINTIIVDPPRSGLNRNIIKDILKINPNKVIYVSCDSATLSRDLKLLNESYEIKGIKLFDLFPNTHHIETVVHLNHI